MMKLFEMISSIFLFDYTNKNIFEYYNLKENKSYSNTIIKLLLNDKQLLEKLNTNINDLTDLELLEQIENNFEIVKKHKYNITKIHKENYQPQMQLLEKIDKRTIYDLDKIYTYSFILNYDNMNEGYLKVTTINLTEKNDFVIYYKFEDIKPIMTEVKKFVKDYMTYSSDLQILPKLLMVTTRNFSPDYNTWDELIKKIPQLKQWSSDVIDYELPTEDDINKSLRKLQNKIGLNESSKLHNKIFSDIIYQIQISLLEEIQLNNKE